MEFCSMTNRSMTLTFMSFYSKYFLVRNEINEVMKLLVNTIVLTSFLKLFIFRALDLKGRGMWIESPKYKLMLFYLFQVGNCFKASCRVWQFWMSGQDTNFIFGWEGVVKTSSIIILNGFQQLQFWAANLTAHRHCDTVIDV